MAFRKVGPAALALILLLAHPSAIAAAGQLGRTEPPTSPAVTSDQHRSLLRLLKQNLWSDRDASDASWTLMVPLHASFTKGQASLRRAYHRFVDRFLADSDTLTELQWSRLQFTYLISRFGALEATRNGCTPRVDRVNAWLEPEAMSRLTASAWQWEMEDFPSVADRILWRLEQPSTDPSYLRAVTDEDSVFMAIAADLSIINHVCDVQSPPTIARMIGLAQRFFRQETVHTPGGGIVIQPGVWRDHPDFLYAGHRVLGPDLAPKPLADIPGDTSHESRTAAVLVSLRCAAQIAGTGVGQYRSLQSALETQLVETLAFRDRGGVKLTNYMDGWNGVYRYGYQTQGPGRGYGPFQLSGTFNQGWWSLLGPKAQELYKYQLRRMPFGQRMLAVYIGPDTTRERNRAFRETIYHASGLAREVISDAARSPFHELCGGGS